MVKLDDSCKDKLNILEVMWIKYFNSTDLNIGYNLASGGLSFTHSDVSKEKMRQKALGKVVSDETKKKLSIVKKGFKHSEETKKVIQWHSINVSDATRKKSSDSRKKNAQRDSESRRKINGGSWFSPEGLLKMKSFNKVNKIKVCMFDKNMNYIKTYDSYVDAAIDINVHQSCISNCCNKKSKSTKGFIFMKESEYKNNLNNNNNDITFNIS